MKTLAFDTSTMTVSLALLEEEKVLSSFQLEGQVGHSETLTDMIGQLFSHWDFGLDEVDLIGVGLGPGSFTGLRISITAAKILSQVLGIPVKGVSSLEALANQVEGEGIIVPILDARRHRLYRSYFRKEGQSLTRLEADEAEDIDQIIDRLKGEERIIFIGDGVKSAQGELKEKLSQAQFISPINSTIQASSIGLLAQKYYREEGGDNLYELEPNYLRPSQAMREYRRKHGQDLSI